MIGHEPELELRRILEKLGVKKPRRDAIATGNLFDQRLVELPVRIRLNGRYHSCAVKSSKVVAGAAGRMLRQQSVSGCTSGIVAQHLLQDLDERALPVSSGALAKHKALLRNVTREGVPRKSSDEANQLSVPAKDSAQKAFEERTLCLLVVARAASRVR